MFQMITFEKKWKNLILKLSVDSSFMKAYIEKINSEDESDSEDVVLHIKQIEDFLNENGLIYGIDEKAINNFIENKLANKSILIAKGDKQIDADDGYVKYIHKSKNSISLNQDEKGNINFKELNWFIQVEENDILAHKISPTEGVDGINIKGEKIKASKGKEYSFRYGKNITVSEDGNALFAAKSGRLEYEGEKLSINDILIIKENVDTSTGNIKFGGDVIVRGDIKSGFSVDCAGSLEVMGVIEASNIKSGKDIVVKGGIQGSAKSLVYCKGNLVCKFIENANIFSESDIITDFIVHSNVNSSGSLTVKGKKGLIVGGEIQVKKDIVTNFLGSSMGTRTNIYMAVDPKQKIELNKNKSNLLEYQKDLKRLQPLIEEGKVYLQKGLLNSIKKLNFVKALEEYNSVLQNITIAETDIIRLEKELSEIKYGFLTVKSGIYPGVSISIGNHKRHIKDETSACRLYVENSDIILDKGF